MSESFAQAVPVLWQLSAKLLGWRPDDFWRATPEELVSALIGPAQSPTEPITCDAIRMMMEREKHG